MSNKLIRVGNELINPAFITRAKFFTHTRDFFTQEKQPKNTLVILQNTTISDGGVFVSTEITLNGDVALRVWQVLCREYATEDLLLNPPAPAPDPADPETHT